MNKWFVVFVSLVFLVALSTVIYMKGNGKTVSQEIETSESEKTLEVTAFGTTFTPATFRTQLAETLHVNITAKDHDYTFKVKGYPRLDATLPKGKTTPVTISLLGVGEYEYSCGSTCSGKIIVEQRVDNEEGAQD